MMRGMRGRPVSRPPKRMTFSGSSPWNAMVGILVLATGLSRSAHGDSQTSRLSPRSIDVNCRGSALQEAIPAALLEKAPARQLALASTLGNRVSILAKDGTLLHSWGGYGAAPGSFKSPRAACVSANLVYVADTDNHRVQCCDLSGRPLSSWGDPENGGERPFCPTGIAMEGDGSVLVADYVNHQVTRFSPSGRVLARWGRRGTQPGEFERPISVAVGREGTVYVAEFTTHRIQRFSADGSFLGQWGGFGAGPGQFNGPVAIDVCTNSDIVVADYYNARLQRFTCDGGFVGQFELYDDLDVAVLPAALVISEGDDAAYVLSSEGGKIRRVALRLQQAPSAPGGRDQSVPVTTGPAAIPPEPSRALSNTACSLGPPRPNPTRDRIDVEFTVAQESEVMLEIYDVSGRMIRRVAGAVTMPGRHVAQWDGTDTGGRRVGAGIYFARLSGLGFSVQRKFILAR